MASLVDNVKQSYPQMTKAATLQHLIKIDSHGHVNVQHFADPTSPAGGCKISRAYCV